MVKPRVIIFNTISVDGRMDHASGEVDMGLYYGLAAGWKADAMLSGSNTMLSAFAGQPMPDENVAEPKELHPLASPYLVIADSRGQIHNWRQIMVQPFWDRVVVLCSLHTPQAYLDELRAVSIPCIRTGEEHVDFRQALEELNTSFDIQCVRVDSGGILNGVLLRAGLVDEVSLLLDPCLVGGQSARSFFVAADLADAYQLIPLRLIHSEQVKPDVLWLRYAVQEAGIQ